MARQQETEESGPVKNGIWDTRTRENSRWCSGCQHWLSLTAFTVGTLDERLKFHQKNYCRNHPDYAPNTED